MGGVADVRQATGAIGDEPHHKEALVALQGYPYKRNGRLHRELQSHVGSWASGVLTRHSQSSPALSDGEFFDLAAFGQRSFEPLGLQASTRPGVTRLWVTVLGRNFGADTR